MNYTKMTNSRKLRKLRKSLNLQQKIGITPK